MKTNRLAILTIILLCTSSILAITQTASTQTVVAGVSRGETFDYSFSLLWTSTDPAATPPNELVEYNNTQQIQFRITDVSGTILTVDFIRHFKNGTQSLASGTINIQSGLVTVPYGFFIIGANLVKNERVYPTGGYQTILDTVMRSYPSGQRETNVISGSDSSQNTTIYFDKIKGIAVEYFCETFETSGASNTVTTEKIVNTNSDVWATSSPTPTATQNGNTASPTPSPSAGTTTPAPTNGGTATTGTPAPTNGITIGESTDIIIVAGIIATIIIIASLSVTLRRKKTRKPEIIEDEEVPGLSEA